MASYHSQRNEWWSGAVREDEATGRRQKTEKGHGGRGGIWGTASGEVPGNSHHSGSVWHRVVANVPSNTFFVKGEAGKSLPPGPSEAQPSGGMLSAMWALPTASHVFIFPSTHPLLLLAICWCPREDGTHKENHQDALSTTDAVEGLSNLKAASGLRQKGEVSVMLIELRWDHTQIAKIFWI